MRVYNLRSALQKPEFITGLYLNRMELKEVPQEVFRLPNLQELDLSYNQIGILPEELGQLIHLERLVLSHNCLEALPLALGRLHALRELRLEHNRIESWPEVLNGMPGLDTLNVSHNQLEQIPASAGKLTGLRTLDLGHNRIKKLPAAIGQWTSLRVLILRRNRLGRLPAAIGDCRSLDHLDLAGNRLQTLPPALASLQELRLLDLSRNRFITLPEPVLTCSHLRHLAVAGNRIEQLPAAIGHLQWLAYLDLSNNQLEQLPAQLPACVHLQVLLLEKNKLEVLPSLGGLSRLRQLNIDRNQLRVWPVLPPGVKILAVSRNMLSACPASIGELQVLEKLDLSHNPLSALPASLVQLQQLQFLDLRRTALHTWPPYLIELDQLKELKTDWPAARRKDFFRLLRACVQANVPASIRRQLEAVLVEGAADVSTLSWRALFWAVNLKYPMVRRLARAELFRRRGRDAVELDAESRLCILGRTAVAQRQLQARLEAQKISVISAPDMMVTHFLLGEFPGWDPILADFAGVLLTEPQVVNWLDEREGRYLRKGIGPHELDRLRELLLHEDAINVQLAVQMMRGGGVPADLLTELLIAWKKAKSGKLRRDLKQLLWQYTPEAARRVLEMPLSLSSRQPEGLLRANIARVCEGTPFEEGKLLREIMGDSL